MIGNFLPALQIGRRIGTSIRENGSGNPGARNVGRVFGKKAFLFVFLVDAGKGAFVVLGALWLDGRPIILLLALTAVMLGHCYPIVHRFKGGKGAATFVGGVVVFNPLLILASLLCFAVLYPTLKKFTAASVLATLAIIPCIYYLYDGRVTLIALLVVGLLLKRHSAAFHFTRERNRPR